MNSGQSNKFYVHQQASDKGGESAYAFEGHQSDAFGPKKKVSQGGQYLLDIIRQLEDIEANWAKLLKNSDQEIERAKKHRIEVQDDEAFIHCQGLLDEQYETEEEKFTKVRRQLKVSLQTFQEHIQICESEKKQRAQEIESLKAEIEQLEGQESNYGKKVKRKHDIREKIQDYTREIQNAAMRLQAAKQKSYEQKGLYLQTQQIEMNILDEIAKVQDEEKIYFEFRGREDKYKQLTRIVQKLHSKTNAGSKDVQSYLKDKINSMAHLRTSLLSLDDKLQQYTTSIEEQYYVIEGLKRRGQDEREVDDMMFRKYQNKYEQLYFSRNNDLSNWKNYKSYLQELIKKDQMEPYLHQRNTHTPQQKRNDFTASPLRKTSHSRRYSNMRTEPGLTRISEEQQDPKISHRFRGSSTPYTMSNSLKGESSIRLPKLVRMRGRQQQSGKIKQNLKKMINESDVSLESVNSDEALSGEFIEVEFHKK